MTTTIDEVKAAEREPKAIADVLAFSTKNRDEYIAEHARQWALDPENVYVLGVCKRCSASLGEGDEAKVIPMGRHGFLPNVICENCVDKAKAEFLAEERKERDRKFSGIIPAEFLTWEAGKGNERLASIVRGKFSYTDRMGFVIHGTTGKCKTRIVWQLVKGICEQPEGFSWAVLDSFECATKGFPPEAERAQFLFIDDLGNEPTSTKFETSLLHLIRRRCDWHKPIFITTQLTGSQFKARFFGGPTGVAILRRLTERCTYINADGI